MSEGFITLYQLVVIVTASCGAAVMLFAAADARALLGEVRRRESCAGAVLLAVFVLALALRWLLPPHALFHDHNHGYAYLEVMFDTGPHSYRLEYGVGGFNVYRMLLRLLPADASSVFALNSVLGALTVFPVYALSAGLWQSRRAGLFAALVIALLPPHIRLSGTEDLYVLAALLEATTLAALVAYLRRGARRHLALAVAAVVVCVSVRETMNLVPLVCLAYALWLVPNVRARLADRALWIAGGAALVLGLPHILFFARYSLADFGAQAPMFDGPWVVAAGRQMLSSYNVYLDASVVFPFVGVAALLGTVLGFRQRPRALSLTWGALILFMCVASLKSLTDADRVMFHAHYGVYLAALVGIGCVHVVDLVKVPNWPRLSTVVVVVLLMVMPVTAHGFLRHRSNIQREFSCANAGAPRVPANCRIVTLRNRADVGSEPIAANLSGLPRFERQQLMSIGDYLSQPADASACYVYYEQRICYEPTMDEVVRYCAIDPKHTSYPEVFACIARYRDNHPEVYQPACKRMHSERSLEPLATCRFRSVPLDVDPMPTGRVLDIGYYRIGPRATSGAAGPDTPRQSDPDPRR